MFMVSRSGLRKNKLKISQKKIIYYLSKINIFKKASSIKNLPKQINEAPNLISFKTRLDRLLTKETADN